MRPRPIALVLSLSGVTAIATACGSGAIRHYNRQAFRSCIEDAGAQTSRVRDLPLVGNFSSADQKEKIVRRLPGSFVARFSSGEILLVYGASSSDGATTARDWVVEDRKTGTGVKPVEMSLDGNLLILTFVHPTVGTETTIDDCKKQAEKT